MNKEVELQVTCPANLNSLYFLDDFCEHSLSFIGSIKKEWICFAAHEVFINIIEATRQQYGDSHNKKLSMRISSQNNEIEIEISDEVSGIPDEILGSVRIRTFEDVLLEENSRGLMMIHHIADEWQYEADGNKGIFTLRFRGEI
ncbi:histidine kinase-like protein [Aneurinibacillus soli]|uniref:Histidine kinase/HSP90-like ATPase domain-containing protein n=1 Tax=Aneurinibacillus soli TaxID=1500254 RepID=A0A0U5BHQ2_9BACL|nr:ATP-binding protein [Aneurinibacillus soli]PYE60629.1 histidine kinase-like protein [Aneurinibacillus soli]BAU29847.1 hypothetical protein CB4_04101 [Aneurinibacillus soli]